MSNTTQNTSILPSLNALPNEPNLSFQVLPNAEYNTTHERMLACIMNKIAHKKQNTPLADELWLVEHADVYTLGQAGKDEHILMRTNTPIIYTDRGGQVTWHGRGQLVVYFLWDLQALGFGVRDLVSHAEQAIEDTINAYLPAKLIAKAQKSAPGVYLYTQKGELLGKIASLGFKIKHGHSYHGIAINLYNDLSAFLAINPCGYAGMTMLRLMDFADFEATTFAVQLVDNLIQRRKGILPLRPPALA